MLTTGWDTAVKSRSALASSEYESSSTTSVIACGPAGMEITVSTDAPGKTPYLMLSDQICSWFTCTAEVALATTCTCMLTVEPSVGEEIVAVVCGDPVVVAVTGAQSALRIDGCP